MDIKEKITESNYRLSVKNNVKLSLYQALTAHKGEDIMEDSTRKSIVEYILSRAENSVKVTLHVHESFHNSIIPYVNINLNNSWIDCETVYVIDSIDDAGIIKNEIYLDNISDDNEDIKYVENFDGYIKKRKEQIEKIKSIYLSLSDEIYKLNMGRIYGQEELVMEDIPYIDRINLI